MPEPRRGSEWRTRLLSQEIIVAEADGRLLSFMSLSEGESPQGSELTIDTRERVDSLRAAEAQRQAWVPESHRGSTWRTRLISQDIIVAEADGRLLAFRSLAQGGYIDFAYIRAEAVGA